MPPFGRREDRSFACVQRVSPISSALTMESVAFMLTSEFQGERDKDILI